MGRKRCRYKLGPKVGKEGGGGGRGWKGVEIIVGRAGKVTAAACKPC